jgi:iron(III) transport system ATP-binding protein
MQLINDIDEKLNIRFIMVSHDATDMLSWADHLIIMDQGKIIQQAEPKQLYDHPLNEHVAGLLGEYNVCDAVLVQLLTNTSSPLAKGEKYLIRPENIYITKEDRGVGITIENVYFKGSYSLLNCRLDNHDVSIIISASGFQNFKIGESFYINTSMNQVVVVG